MVREQLRTVKACDDYPGMSRSKLELMDRIGIKNNRYSHCGIYREIQTYNPKFNAVSIQIVHGRFAFDPQRYTIYMESARIRCVGEKLHHSVSARRVGNIDYEFEYGRRRGITTIEVLHDFTTGNARVRFTKGMSY